MITTPSPEQEDIFTAIKQPDGPNIIIGAVAGSGKSSTIIHSTQYLPRTARILFSAFNNSTVDELKSRLPTWLDTRTFHSASYAALRNLLPATHKVERFKSRIMFETICPDRRERQTYNPFVAKLVGYMKSTPGTCAGDLVKHHGMICEGTTRIGIDYAEQVFAASNLNLNLIDFDDMLWLTYHLNAPVRTQYDIMFVDEAQDYSTLQHALMQRMLRPSGRVIVVGDHRQAIYGFRGADSASMSKLKDTFSCVEFPLSTCYRCSSSVIDEVYARCLPGHTIRSAPNAERGSVNHLTSWRTDDLDDNDAIICRNNAPLVRIAFALLSQRRRATVLGRDIGQGLTSLVKKLKPLSISDLQSKLLAYREEETAKDPDNSGPVNDRCDCLEIFTQNARTVDEVANTINSIFADKDSQGIVLGTVHKLKGTEFPNTYILDPWLMPSKFAKQAWQQQQEDNIQYVGITRAKQNLTYIDTNDYTR